jgi:hypothetical protein
MDISRAEPKYIRNPGRRLPGLSKCQISVNLFILTISIPYFGCNYAESNDVEMAFSMYSKFYDPIQAVMRHAWHLPHSCPWYVLGSNHTVVTVKAIKIGKAYYICLCFSG